MKPKDWWIVVNDKGGFRTAYECEQPELGPGVYQVHVREVVPIDWEKVWNKYFTGPARTGWLDKKEIEQLVEKQLEDGNETK